MYRAAGATRSGLRLAVLALALVLTGCLSTMSRPGGGGELAIRTDLAPLRAAGVETGAVVAILSQNRRTLTVPLVLDGEAAVATVPRLLAGVWQVRIEARDAEGDVPYAGTGTVTVRPGQNSSVQLALLPQPGRLSLTLDLSGFPELEAAQKARLLVQPGGTTSFERQGEGPLQVERELPPGSYDARIALYEDAYYSSKLIYESPWWPCTIRPGKTTSLVWRPQTGVVEVGGRVEAPPPPLPAPQLQLAGRLLTLTWEPSVAPDAAAYRLYWREDTLLPFTLLAEVRADTHTYTHDLASVPPGSLVGYVVTVVDQGGQESLRSPEATLSLP